MSPSFPCGYVEGFSLLVVSFLDESGFHTALVDQSGDKLNKI